jgi:MSHA biogenesis protein MshJ
MTALSAALEKIDALTPRERVILFLLLLAGIWAVLDALLLGPQDKARQAEQARMQEITQRIATAQDTLTQLASRPDPGVAARQRLAGARQALEARLNETRQVLGQLVPAREMARVLEGLLKNQPGLRLARLETLAPQAVGLAPGAKPEEAALFRQGIRITLGGDYAALVRYMESLEKLPAGFHWAQAELDATHHPELLLTLTLHTLSMERTWLTL